MALHRAPGEAGRDHAGGTAATNHAAIVQALEMMTAPVTTVAQRLRSTEAESQPVEPTEPEEGQQG